MPIRNAKPGCSPAAGPGVGQAIVLACLTMMVRFGTLGFAAAPGPGYSLKTRVQTAAVWSTWMRLPSLRGFKKTTGSRRGQSLIEFSLAAPLLLIIGTGMVWFGFALYEQIVLTNGVNAGALVLALSRDRRLIPVRRALRLSRTRPQA